MSTFKGVVEEFPDIRIDYFRKSSDPNDKPPLACFLSHIHSDHLQGLEGNYAAPFIYCSAATKELLIKLERKMHRLNWQQGIVESYDCKYKEKSRLLKAIPLDTPTWVEVGINKKIRVTLIDANHCVGAVMFLMEGDGKAILYTGDIRAEDWWVENLKRHPVLLPYTTGVKALDKIYLDTSWGWQGYEKFSSKQAGITELISKMKEYPETTRFHFNTWTFGYEEIWTTLASVFGSKIHLSPYHYRLFKSLKTAEQWAHAPYLCGHKVGNAEVEGMLTTNPDVRIHSCERGLECPGLRDKGDVVYITPIIARTEGDGRLEELTEDGLDIGDLTDTSIFPLHNQIQLILDNLGPSLSAPVRDFLITASKSRTGSLSVPSHLIPSANRDLKLPELLALFQEQAAKKAAFRIPTQRNSFWPGTTGIRLPSGEVLPTWLKFPYSRHSSLGELRNLVGLFRPKDVYPCVSEEGDWNEKKSMEMLYGGLCSEERWAHDNAMREAKKRRERVIREREAMEEEWALQSQLRMDMNATQFLSTARESDSEDDDPKGRDATPRAESSEQELERDDTPEKGSTLPAATAAAADERQPGSETQHLHNVQRLVAEQFAHCTPSPDFESLPITSAQKAFSFSSSPPHSSQSIINRSCASDTPQNTAATSLSPPPPLTLVPSQPMATVLSFRSEIPASSFDQPLFDSQQAAALVEQQIVKESTTSHNNNSHENNVTSVSTISNWTVESSFSFRRHAAQKRPEVVVISDDEDTSISKPAGISMISNTSLEDDLKRRAFEEAGASLQGGGEGRAKRPRMEDDLSQSLSGNRRVRRSPPRSTPRDNGGVIESGVMPTRDPVPSDIPTTTQSGRERKKPNPPPLLTPRCDDNAQTLPPSPSTARPPIQPAQISAPTAYASSPAHPPLATNDTTPSTLSPPPPPPTLPRSSSRRSLPWATFSSSRTTSAVSKKRPAAQGSDNVGPKRLAQKAATEGAGANPGNLLAAPSDPGSRFSEIQYNNQGPLSTLPPSAPPHLERVQSTPTRTRTTTNSNLLHTSPAVPKTPFQPPPFTATTTLESTPTRRITTAGATSSNPTTPTRRQPPLPPKHQSPHHPSTPLRRPLPTSPPGSKGKIDIGRSRRSSRGRVVDVMDTADLYDQISPDSWADMDLARVREAAEAALGVGGKTWWGVEIGCVGLSVAGAAGAWEEEKEL